MHDQSESVAEVMTHPAVVIDPYWSVSEVFWLSALKKIHHFPIVDRGSLVGIVCTCDLRNAAPGEPVGKYARREVATIEPTCDAAQAARLMLERAIGSAVVVDAAGVRGIVTRGDLENRADAKHRLVEDKCTACGSHQHLRSGPDGFKLCSECRERARRDDWFEVGVAD